eukprot:Sdes_comp19037_c0_seq2m9609
MEDAHILDERDDFFFQTDQELEKAQSRREKVNYTKGKAIKVPSKILDMKMAGNFAFIAGAGKAARKINLLTGKTAKIYKGHSGPVTSIAILNEDVIFTGSWDKTIIEWCAHTKAQKGQLCGHSDFIKCLLVSPDGGFLFSGSSDATIRKWDVQSRRCLQVFEGHKRAVEDIFIQGSFLFSASSDSMVKKWDLETGANVFTYSGHLTSVYSVVERDGYVYSASADCFVHKWDSETGEESCKVEEIEVDGSLLAQVGEIEIGSEDGVGV